MAIDKRIYTESVERGLKADLTYTHFYLRFKKGKNQFYRVTTYEGTSFDKRTRIRKAKEWANQQRDQVENIVDFDINTTLNTVAKVFFDKKCEPSAWTDDRMNHYRLYWQDSIGSKKVKDIRQIHIDTVKADMLKKGHSKQSENGLSPRSIKKVMLQVLKPILEYAKVNKLIDELPEFDVPKQKRQKKVVTDAGQKLAILYKSIMDMYQDDPFYRALFLFALYGRRWNEIRTLTWTDIDFLNNRYTVRAENNKIGQNQTYDLPRPINETLHKIQDDHVGLVFKSPKTSKELYTPKKQLAKLKAHTDIPELTMHYFRHILVSAMGETGVAGTVLSASLGHTNLDTVNQFYLSASHTKASKKANDIITSITNSDSVE